MNTKQNRNGYKSLSAWREACGLSQHEAATLFGVTQPCYSRWENGSAHPRGAAQLEAISKKTGVSVAALMGVAA